MKKIFLSALILSFMLATNGYAATKTDAFGRPINNLYKTANHDFCEKKCSGYSKDIVSCPEGFKVTSCEAKGCGEYKKCIKNPCKDDFDTNVKTCPIETQEDDYQCTRCM